MKLDIECDRCGRTSYWHLLAGCERVFTNPNTIEENIRGYMNGTRVPVCFECGKDLTPDELGYGHDCESDSNE